jgi:hypothetical protein
MKTRLLVLALALLVLPAAGSTTFVRPEVIRFGATAAELQAALSAGSACKTMKLRPIVPPFLPDTRKGQVQIDCDGFAFMGKPRWTEFVIGDDALEMVWILTTREEQETLRAAMIAAYGQPSHVNATYVAFTQARAALRLDKPEVLFYSERQAAQLLADFK